MTEQIAVVTGAAGGFGTAICESLLKVNYAVAAVDLNLEGLQQLEHKLGSSSKLFTYQMDVTNFDQVSSVCERLKNIDNSAVTVLVNNAGVLDRSFCLHLDSPQKAARTFDVNLTGAFNCTTLFSQIMARQRYGRIINIASVAGIWGAKGGAAYAASKAGLIKASESWACELGPLNICVTAIAPGVCITSMYDKYFKDENLPAIENIPNITDEKSIQDAIPAGRFGTAEDIAEVVTFLATCKTNYITSAVIEVDGGLRVGEL